MTELAKTTKGRGPWRVTRERLTASAAFAIATEFAALEPVRESWESGGVENAALLHYTSAPVTVTGPSERSQDMGKL
jgi:hypothetical protein